MYNHEGMYGTVITIMHRMENVRYVCVVGNCSSVQENIC
jgi:hypothetical protein